VFHPLHHLLQVCHLGIGITTENSRKFFYSQEPEY